MIEVNTAEVKNIFTVDLEDWFCVANMEKVFPFESWQVQEIRLETPTHMLLDLLARHSTRATFFVMGWIAEQLPNLVREIAEAGHEIGVHSYAHRRLTAMEPQEFIQDLRRALDVISSIVPRESVTGYRAPSFTVTPKTSWALDILVSQGLFYDSSVMPVAWNWHPDYGWRGACPKIHRLENGLVEVPPTAGLGGGYFRLFPYNITRKLIRNANSIGCPAVFYIHPWELDIGQPKVSLPYIKRLRHYVNIEYTAHRLEHLLNDFSFGCVSEVLKKYVF